MELWIRSQDREILEQVRYLYIDTNCHDMPDAGEWNIIDDGISLGTYKTKKRALEVLNEIQLLINRFEPKNMARMIVYKMPEV